MRLLFSTGCLILTLLSINVWADTLKSIRMPPDSLAQWYKPANKRQVWLHTMFSLRREMQAVEEYAAEQSLEGTQKWGQRLVEHYRKIPEMVPEWSDEVDLNAADGLERATTAGNFDQVKQSLKKLSNTCNSCHREYRELAAALYRTPDYSKLQMRIPAGSDISFPDLMQELSALVNRVKIASEDGRQARALEALGALKVQLQTLGTSCGSCHQDEAPKERILGAATTETLEALEHALQKSDSKETGKLLGEAAVIACARCHGVHRTLAGLKGFLEPLTTD